MENVWHLFNNNNNNTSSERGQSNHSTTNNNPHHHEWQPGDNLAQPYNFINNNATPTTTITHCVQDGGNYGPMFPHHHHIYSSSSSSTLFGTSSNESGGSTYYHPDPHLPSLKLGKRHYFENANNNNNVVFINRQQESEVIKKNLINGQEEFSWGGYGGLIWQPQSTSTATGTTMAPRCQVEGCSVILVDAKYYHKRHKVCEKHSKAPKVMVLGIEQRFCQQCSRFHAISEFDESKRSCRRRLAGHNERRRKSSQDQSAPKNLTPDKVMGGGCGYLPLLSRSSAHSLMSSNNTQFNSSPNLSEQSSAALHELIVENRAALSVWQVHDGNRHSWRNNPMEDQIDQAHQNHRINCFSSEEMGSGCWEDMNAGAHLSLEHQAGSKFSI